MSVKAELSVLLKKEQPHKGRKPSKQFNLQEACFFLAKKYAILNGVPRKERAQWKALFVKSLLKEQGQ